MQRHLPTLLLAAACSNPTSGTDGGGDATIDGPVDASVDVAIADAPADVTTEDAGAHFNYAFVTSQKYVPGNLGGLAGADAKCNGLAAAAGIPGTYIALLSSGPTDGGPRVNAIDRFPAAARGWVRRDGKPVLDRISDHFAKYQMFYPLRMDETGAELTTVLDPVATATDWSSGDYDPSYGDCAGYTVPDGGGFVTVGYDYDEGFSFTSAGGLFCWAPARLYCFEIDYDTPVSVPAPTGTRTAFLSATTLPGSSTLAAFDQACGADALDAGLSGSYEAFVGVADASAASRFDADGGTWRRPDGVLVALTASDFLSGAEQTAALDQHANTTFPSSAEVWNGSTGNTCGDWTSDAGMGGALAADRSASSSFDVPCAWPLPVYCLER